MPEVRYAVDPGWPLSDLAAVVPEGGPIERPEHALESTYLDTDAHALTGLGVTLRRRTDGDGGWQLSVPGDGAGLEVPSRSRQRTPPKALLAPLGGVLGGEALGLVATISTTRQVHRILDAEGAVVAEVYDDDTRAVATGDEATLEAWREIRVEPGPAGGRDVLSALRKLLRKAGARKRGATPTLERVLREDSGAEDGALSRYLRLQCRRILLGEIGLRHEPTVDGIHDTRVAIRRLRSILRLSAPLLEGVPDELDDDLRRLARLLQEVRDADVLTSHLARKVDALPEELVLGPVRQELAETLGADRKAALRRWVSARDDERYLRTLGIVLAFHRVPPVADLGSKALRKKGEKLLLAARRKARKRLAGAGDDPVRLHRARKAVKRLRYNAEALEAEVPKAARTAHHAEDLQGVLGEHQDLVVEAAFLRRIAATYGGREGHNGFTYGILLAGAEREAAKIREGRPAW